VNHLLTTSVSWRYWQVAGQGGREGTARYSLRRKALFLEGKPFYRDWIKAQTSVCFHSQYTQQPYGVTVANFRGEKRVLQKIEMVQARRWWD
jgi:hypothetical protein